MFFSVLCLLCLCVVCLFVPCGHLLGKGWPIGFRFWCITVSLSLSHWYPGSGVVLDCINSWSLHPMQKVTLLRKANKKSLTFGIILSACMLSCWSNLVVALIEFKGTVYFQKSVGKDIKKSRTFIIKEMSQCMRFPTMWYVRQAKPQISLRIRAVWSEPFLVAWVFYVCYATDWTPFGVCKLKMRLYMLVWVYTCQNATLLEITCHGS